MLKWKLSLSNLTLNRRIATSMIFRNELPSRFDQEVPSFKPMRHTRSRKIEEDKKRLEWRQNFKDMPGFYKSKLSMFDSDDHVPSSLELVAQPIDLSTRGIKKWWSKYQLRKERYLQQFIPERNEILGNDLAAAHFLLFRGGKVKFVGQREWIEINEEEPQNIPLPNKYDPNFEVEAIKCDNMALYYEGLDNIRRLKKLKYISFRNVKLFDDWSLDRISGSEFTSLETLDISGTSVSANGLQALYRIPSLKKLIADDQPEENISWYLTVAMLQDIIPELKVESSNIV